jgi:hypothetical protein
MHPAWPRLFMSIRLASFLVVAALLAAASLALFGGEHSSDATAATVRPLSPSPPLAMGGEEMPSENGGMLPPNHPPIGGAMSPHGSAPSATSEAPSLVWKTPVTWQEAPSPNAMRLATYRVPGGAEVSVSRAGGEKEANIQRWVEQFDDVGHQGRVEKTVHGLRVVTVDIAGTYVGGAMAMGAQAEAHPRWAMVGAIVEGPGLPYFFKMTGPAAGVRSSRPAFDLLIDSIAPM